LEEWWNDETEAMFRESGGLELNRHVGYADDRRSVGDSERVPALERRLGRIWRRVGKKKSEP